MTNWFISHRKTSLINTLLNRGASTAYGLVGGMLMLVWVLNPVRAQQTPTYFEHLSAKDGLSNNSVNCILQDQEGFMWFATSDGLNKYDGYSFTVYRATTNRPDQPFSDNTMNALYEDRAQRLWALTDGGLHEVNKRTGQVTPHLIQGQPASQWNKQLTMVEDHQRMLWLSTYAGLARYDAQNHHFTLYPSPRSDIVVKQVVEDQQHRLWVATSHGLYQFDRKTGRFTLLSIADGDQPNFDYLYLDGPGRLWISSVGRGLFQLDLDQQPLRILPFRPNTGLINPFLFQNALHRDAQGFLWIGTTDGLQQVDLTAKTVITYRPNPRTANGLSSVYAQSVYHDKAGTLWVGTNNGIDKKTATTTVFQTHQITSTVGSGYLFENRSDHLLVDSLNRIWVGNFHGAYRLDTDRKRVTAIPPARLGSTPDRVNSILSFQSDGATGVWISTQQGLYHYTAHTDQYTAYPSQMHGGAVSRSPTGDIWQSGEEGISSFNPLTHRYTYYRHPPTTITSFTSSLLVSRSGSVWATRKEGGLLRLNPQTGRLICYRGSSRLNPLQTDRLLALYEDQAGMIWVGTNRSGLCQLNPQTGRWRNITIGDGLPTNRIVSIVGDKAGYLWLGTDQGLCRFDPRTKSVRTYDVNDGLPSNEFLEKAVFRRGNTLYFGTLNGFVDFDPDQLGDQQRAFPVYLTRFQVNNEPRPLSDQPVRLAYDENAVSFDFVALTHRLPQQSRYAYQLTGVDPTWVLSGNRRFVSYTNLPPGDYVFRVKAANSDGVWTKEGAMMHLIIEPPWWATGWAYLVYIGLFGGILWGAIRAYTHRIRQRHTLELERREAEQLRLVEEMKSRFFTNITHEFRTPLTLILGPLERLKTVLKGPEQRWMTTIERNAQRLLGLINQLLDLSKLEAGLLPVHPTRGSLAQTVRYLVEAFEEESNDKGIRLELHHELLTDEYWFDADKLMQIGNNLVANALKWTPPAGVIAVTLSHYSPIEAEPGEAQNPPSAPESGIYLTVSDTGIGIPAQHLPFIFNRFYQVSDAALRPRSAEESIPSGASPLIHPSADGQSVAPGSGIGLALVKELIELQGGWVRVSSQQVELLPWTTRFIVWLPYQPVLETPAVPTSDWMDLPAPGSMPPVLDEEPQAPAVLIVEDNPELTDFIAESLPPTYRISRAANGQLGLEAAIESGPDLIISDVMMPVMDGFSLCQRLKADATTNHIPLILLTAKAAHTSRLAGLSVGADDYLTKPFHVDELRLRVHNLLLRQQRLRAWVRQSLTQVRQPAPSPPVQDPFLGQLYAVLDQSMGKSDLTVDQLADALAVSIRTLHRKLASLTGMSANELMRSYRLRQAARLLQSGQLVTAVAYEVGFENLSYFAKCFKEQFGVSPSEYLAGPHKP